MASINPHSGDQPIPVDHRPRIIVFFVIIIVVVIAGLVLKFLEGKEKDTAKPSSRIESEMSKPSQVAENVEIKQIPLPVIDIWTGGKTIVFIYSQPNGGPVILMGINRVDDNGKTRIPVTEVWWHRFIEAYIRDQGNKSPQLVDPAKRDRAT